MLADIYSIVYIETSSLHIALNEIVLYIVWLPICKYFTSNVFTLAAQQTHTLCAIIIESTSYEVETVKFMMKIMFRIDYNQILYTLTMRIVVCVLFKEIIYDMNNNSNGKLT